MTLQQQRGIREQASRSGGDRDWSARIRASIVRLLEIDGVCLDRDTRRETVQSLEEWQQLQDRVDRVEAASEVAHSVYWDTLRDVYKSSPSSRPEPNAKRMRMTKPSELSLPSGSARQPRHEALDTLVLAAATEQSSEQEVLPKAKPSKRPHKHPLLVQGKAGSQHHPLPVHDRQVVKAVDKLSGKLTQLLSQVQAASDAAVAEPLLATAATIALEATQMLRCEEVAMARMMEIEEHRQKIAQGLEEYAQRKGKRKANDKRC